MKASLPYKYITSVKNGKYYVIFDFKDKNNNRKRKWVKTDLPAKCSKKALNAKVDELVAEFEQSYYGTCVIKSDSNEDSNTGSVKVTKYMTDWLAAVKPDMAKTTHQGYRAVARGFSAFIEKEYPDITLGTINHTIIQEYFNFKISQGVKGSTIKVYYLALHSAFAYAVRMEMIDVHPMDKLKVPRTDKFEATFYNKDELNELFGVFEGDPLELVVHIAAYYGLRRCEILGLKWDAIDFKEKTISIQRKVIQVYDEDGTERVYVENRLKTNSTRRTLPLIPHIEKMLLDKKKLDAHNKKFYGNSYDNEYDGFICRLEDGTLIKPNFVTSHFHEVVKKNELRHLRFHDLRHSCASLLLANDIPMKSIQEWLGHTNFTITANLYSHLEYNAKIASAETIARVLDGDKAPAKVEKSKRGRKKKSDTSETNIPKPRGRKKKNGTVTENSDTNAVT